MFANLLIILASSLVVIALFRRLQLPPVLGYLCVGLRWDLRRWTG